MRRRDTRSPRLSPPTTAFTPQFPCPSSQHPEQTHIAVSLMASAGPRLLGKGCSTRGGSPPPPSVDQGLYTVQGRGSSRPPATYPSLPRVSCRELGSGVVPLVSDRVGVTLSIVPGASPAQPLLLSLLRTAAGRQACPSRSSFGFCPAAVSQEERRHGVGFPMSSWAAGPLSFPFP